MKTHRHTHTHSHFWSLSSIQSWKLILRHVLGHHYHKATALTQTHWRKTTEKNKRAICTLVVVVVPSSEAKSQQHCLVKFLAAAAVEWWQIQDIFHFLFSPSLPLLWGPKCPPQPQASYFKFEFFYSAFFPHYLCFSSSLSTSLCVCALAINLPLRPQLWFLVHCAHSAGRFVFECRSFLPSFFLFHILIFILFFKAAKNHHTHTHTKPHQFALSFFGPYSFRFLALAISSAAAAVSRTQSTQILFFSVAHPIQTHRDF